jgi:hypothetical protein
MAGTRSTETLGQIRLAGASSSSRASIAVVFHAIVARVLAVSLELAGLELTDDLGPDHVSF